MRLQTNPLPTASSAHVGSSAKVEERKQAHLTIIYKVGRRAEDISFGGGGGERGREGKSKARRPSLPYSMSSSESSSSDDSSPSATEILGRSNV